MANDFTGDGSCVALYRMENSALGTDTIGGNTLTVSGVSNDFTYEQEGNSCGYFDGATDYMYRTDSGLDAGFPFRENDASPNKNMTICMFLRFTNLTAAEDQSFISKYDSSGGLRSWRLKMEDDDNKFYWQHGHNNGADYETGVAFGTAFVIDRWYHCAFTLDEDENYTARIYDITADALLDTDMSNTFSNVTSAMDTPLMLGAHGTPGTVVNDHRGYQDEVVFFDEIKSTSDTDLIRQQIYPADLQSLLPIYSNAKKFIQNNSLLRR